MPQRKGVEAWTSGCDFDHHHALFDHWQERGFVRSEATHHVHGASDVEGALDDIALAWSVAPLPERDAFGD